MWRFPGRISIGTFPSEDMIWPVLLGKRIILIKLIQAYSNLFDSIRIWQEYRFEICIWEKCVVCWAGLNPLQKPSLVHLFSYSVTKYSVFNIFKYGGQGSHILSHSMDARTRSIMDRWSGHAHGHPWYLLKAWLLSFSENCLRNV